MRKVLKDADIDFTFENKELAQVLSPTKQSMLVMITREAIIMLLNMQMLQKFMVN